VALSFTAVPDANVAVQICPQSSPAGSDRTTPEPCLATVTEKEAGGGGGGGGVAVKRAVTAASAFMFTVHAPWPEQAPSQPEKTEPPAAVAVRVTAVPCTKLAVQVSPQSIPDGVETTAPPPLELTVSACAGGPPLGDGSEDEPSHAESRARATTVLQSRPIISSSDAG